MDIGRALNIALENGDIEFLKRVRDYIDKILAQSGPNLVKAQKSNQVQKSNQAQKSNQVQKPNQVQKLNRDQMVNLYISQQSRLNNNIYKSAKDIRLATYNVHYWTDPHDRHLITPK